MNDLVHRQRRRFANALRGIQHGLRRDLSFQIQAYIGGLFIIAFWFMMQPLAPNEGAFLLLSWTLVLITELQNASFERALDRMHPDNHEAIGISKDMAAGAVLIAGFFAFGVVVWILMNHGVI